MMEMIASMAPGQDTVIVGVRMEGWVAWIIVGLLAGWLAGHLTRGRGFGCIVEQSLSTCGGG